MTPGNSASVGDACYMDLDLTGATLGAALEGNS